MFLTRHPPPVTRHPLPATRHPRKSPAEVQSDEPLTRGGGEYSHTLPIRVCAAQRGGAFEAPDLERGIHFRGVF